MTTSLVTRRQEERRVLAGTLVGTTIEWYDFFIFAQLTATLLTPLFLAPLGESNPGIAQILSFAMIGISFFFRPLGAVIAGHLGDRFGRKRILVMTLILMGIATSLIGLLPPTRRSVLPHRSCWCCCACCRASPPAANGAARR